MHLSLPNVYRFDGVTFIWPSPIILNRHTGEERPFRSVSRRNWSAINKFSGLPNEEREIYRVY
jgi:hypothetical protein